MAGRREVSGRKTGRKVEDVLKEDLAGDHFSRSDCVWLVSLRMVAFSHL